MIAICISLYLGVRFNDLFGQHEAFELAECAFDQRLLLLLVQV
jgi:hypothetical protein